SADPVGGLVAREVRWRQRQGQRNFDVRVGFFRQHAADDRHDLVARSLGRRSSWAALSRTSAEGADRESEARAGERALRTSLSLAGSSKLPWAVAAAP